MKKIYIITHYALLGLLAAGCTDLDTAPLSSTITADQKEQVVAADPSKLEASVAAVTANFTQYAKLYSEDQNVHSDIGYPTIMLATDSRGTDMIADDIGYNWYAGSLTFSDCLNTSTSTIEFWGTLYNQIFTANAVIGTVDAETTDPTLQFYLAQGLAIRAFDYFTLVQLYQFNYKGHENDPGVPIITPENAEEVATNGCARSTVQETYDFILADLDKAIELLSNSSKTRDDKRYVSLDVAYGIRARVNLAMHKYAEALSDAEAALAHTSSVPYSLTEAGKPSFIDIEDNSWMWGILITDKDRVSTTGICNFPSHMGSLNYGYASVGGWRRISPKLYNQIPDTDIRKGWFLNGQGISANLPAAAQAYITGKGAPVYTQVKYGVINDQWGTDNNAVDVVLMRVEEMYLIKAEAEAMSGNVSAGVNTLNTFINAYRDPSYKCAATTAEAAQEAIWQQRRIEFWGEGLSYFDIMRLNKGVNRLGCGFPETAIFNIAAGDPVLIYSIPNKEVQYNPLLENNPLVSAPTPIPDEE